MCTGTGIGAALSTCIQSKNWYAAAPKHTLKTIFSNFLLGSLFGSALIKRKHLDQPYQD